MSVIIDEETLEALEARGFSVVLTDGRREVRVERGMTLAELPSPPPAEPARRGDVPPAMLDLSEASLEARDGLWLYEWPADAPGADFDIAEAIREAREERMDMLK